MKRFLRLGVFRGGKLVDDRYIPETGEISVGSSARNTFALLGSTLPREHVLFHFHRKHPVLHVVEGMRGQIALDGRTRQSLEELRARGQPEAKGGWAIELPDTARGWVSLGDAVFFLQIGPKPPPPPKRTLPPSAKTGLRGAMESLFVGVLVAVLAVESAGLYAIHRMPDVSLDQPSQEDLDRFAKILMPEKPVDKKKDEDEAAKKAAEDAKKKADEEARKKEEEERRKKEEEAKKKENEDPAKAAAAEAARKEKLKQEVASKGLLNIIGATGGGSSSLKNVFASGNAFGDDITRALAGTGGVKIATGDEGPQRKGGGAGGPASLGDLASAGGGGGGRVNLTEKARVMPQISIDDREFETESSSVDRDGVNRYVRMRIKSIQGCYEKELKRNPGLKGKVVVRFVINPDGRVSEISIETNSMGDEAVAACIVNVIRSWKFPFHPPDAAAVSFPFVFSPGG